MGHSSGVLDLTSQYKKEQPDWVVFPLNNIILTMQITDIQDGLALIDIIAFRIYLAPV